MVAVQDAGHWIVNYILKPLGQILLFIVASALIMSVITILLGAILQTPWHGISILYVRPKIDLMSKIFGQLPTMLINGVTIGFLYAVIALGYTMVYGVLRFINFAHSEIFMVGGVVGFEVLNWLRKAELLASFHPLLLIVVLLLAAMVVSGLLAMLVERLAYRPLRNAPRLVPLISAIGVSFFLQDFVRAVETLRGNGQNYPYATTDNAFFTQRIPITLPGGSNAISLDISAVIVVVCAVIMLLGLNYFVTGTKFGKAIRAVSQDQTTASLMGINVNQIIALTFLIGGALGGAAGILFGIKATNITPYIGFVPGIKAFTAAVLGGIGNLTGALLGGILLGMLESFFSSLLPYFPAIGTQYTDIFAFAVLILVLIFRPSGLLGRRVDEKV